MTIVNCYLESCKYCSSDYVCTRREITLAEEHYCVGGCDCGWVIPEEEEADE